MMDAIISIIIPVYNTESYLRECLDSVKNQSMSEIEIICVDDGSTDSSGAILDEYARLDERFVVIHQPNAGQSAARNKGIDISRGKYVCFLDADDWYESECCQTLYETAEKFNNEFVTAAFREIGGKKQILPLKNSNAVYVDDMDKYCFITHVQFTIWGKLYRKDFIEKHNIRFLEGVCYEDNHFSIKAALCAKEVRHIPNVLYNYRIGTGYSKDPKQVRKRMTVIEMEKYLLDDIFQSATISDELRNTLYNKKLKTYSHFYRRIATPDLKAECRQRILNAISEEEWELIFQNKIPMSIKLRWFLYRLKLNFFQSVSMMIKSFPKRKN